MKPRPAAEDAHLLTELRADERVHDDCGAASRALDDGLEVGDALDHRMPDLLERLVGELRLQCMHQA